MKEMKDSGIEWIGEVPIKWDVAPFKKILIRNDGGLWGDEPNGQNDILVLRSTEQTIDGKWDLQSPAYRDLSNISNLQEYLVKCGDLLITKSSGSDFHIGKTTVADEYIESLSCSFSNFIQRLRVCARINPRYYWYILNSSIARGQFVYLQNSTSGIGNINSKNINEIKVPIPPFDMQYSIVDYLDRKCSQIDAIIARQQEVIEKLKAYKLSVITEAVTKGLNPDVPMKDSGVEWIGEIPEHWDILKLQAHTRMLTPMRDRPEKLDGDIPWVRIEDYDGKYISESKEGLGVSTETVKAMNLKIYPVDSILCTSSCDLGKCAIVTRELVSNQRFINIIPDSNTNSDYLYYLMLSNAERLNYLSTGTIQANLSRKAFEHLMVQFPPISEQKAIAEYLDRKCEFVELSINQKQKLIDRLSSYKKSLIYEVVTGKKSS